MTEAHQPPSISRKIVPPQWFLVLLILEVVLDRWAPISVWIPKPINLCGALFIAAGVFVTVWAALLFKRKKTGLIPFSESTSLVIEGPYRITRNPMYLGMTLILLGSAVLLRSLTPFISPVAFMVIITKLFILPEEVHMERAFGAAYLELKKRVRRWL